MRRSTYDFSTHLKCHVRVTQGCTNWKIMVTRHLGLNQPLWHSVGDLFRFAFLSIVCSLFWLWWWSTVLLSQFLFPNSGCDRSAVLPSLPLSIILHPSPRKMTLSLESGHYSNLLFISISLFFSHGKMMRLWLWYWTYRMPRCWYCY